ncbi:MAG: molybdopterin molybdotransferase MoeA [Candidatus Zixiibacteriota bacterium]|nr:MAG: molybdopterin molybdotransferase MoeA [candidate division Zixibacteria bacterium]
MSSLVSLTEAQQRVQKAVKQLPPRPMPLTSAIGSIVGEDIRSPINVPQFPRSAMDGIAVRTADLKGDGPWCLPIQTVIEAGNTTPHSLLDQHVVKIMTGAPLAEGADAVIKIEDVIVQDNKAVISQLPAPGSFIRPMGNDITSGQVLFRRGDLLRPGDIGILASIGLQQVMVTPRPRIALVSTGSEIVEPGAQLQYGQIYDSNIPTLYSLLSYDRFPVQTQERVRSNDLEPLRETLKRCLEHHDLVITTGAVSMGDYDFIPDIVTALGGKLLFYKVAVKPGKPTLIADMGQCWLVSLPGNPVSVLVGYFLYVRRVVSRLSGLPFEPVRSHATLAGDVRVSGNRFNIVGARLEKTVKGLVAHPSPRQESGRLSSARSIDGLMMIEGGTRTVKKGTQVLVELLNHERLP